MYKSLILVSLKSFCLKNSRAPFTFAPSLSLLASEPELKSVFFLVVCALWMKIELEGNVNSRKVS
jgi:hypothetical protein